MQCLAPWNIPKPNGLGTTDRIEVPCGKCAGCLDTRRNEWTNRLKFELEESTSAYFVTLTYSDEHLIYGKEYGTVSKRDFQLFIKRLRKKSTEKIRYYAVGEYGTQTYRPHYHIILFNLAHEQINYISKEWTYGHVQIGTVTGGSIHYVTKYHLNRTDYPEGSEPPFCLMSRNPGIGSGYVDKYAAYHEGNISRNYILHRGGQISRLPRFYKNKLYSDDERKLIANRAQTIQRTSRTEHEVDYHEYNDGNFYEYEAQQKFEFQNNYKQKSNKKNQL